ncbi:MAG: class I SAM-dependent methyltransferase, partial [Oligoflexia bacterium]|nr:class I SAM-dependent methyltransferase [Oligoflexia bacterium]
LFILDNNGTIKRANTAVLARLIVPLSRNNINCRILSNIIYYLLPKRGRNQIFVDVAGGMGVLTRLMRDVGFHFYWSDKYAENIFAKSFEYAGDVFYKEKKEIFALTAFSFLEHLVDPKAFIKEAIQKHSTKTIIFTMDIFNGVPPSTDWWYYSFKTGQHISFFQEKTLKEMAKNLNLYLYWSKDFYIMSEYVLSNTILKFCTGLLSHFLFLRAKKGTKSLLPNDYDYLLRLGEDDGA